VTESVSERLLRLPFYNGLDEADLSRVVHGIHSFRS
jgi:dTDP-4-amino-4,6-dideoxygalactose transaminase